MHRLYNNPKKKLGGILLGVTLFSYICTIKM